MTLTPEEEKDILRDVVGACAESFDKLADQARAKAALLRVILADPEANSVKVKS